MLPLMLMRMLISKSLISKKPSKNVFKVLLSFFLLSILFFKDDQKIYGQKNKPRNEEPSMYQLLTWKDVEGDNWNYTVKNKNIIESSLTNQLKYRINKSSSNWTTENMDQFRKFTYSPSKQPVFYGTFIKGISNLNSPYSSS